MEKQLIRSGMQEHQSLMDKDSFAYSKCLLVAVDLKLFSSMNSNIDAVLLQNDLDCLFKWCTANKLHLSIEKCRILSYTRKSQPLNHVYKINYLVLSRSDSVTDLEAAREKDWDNIAAIHHNSKIVTTWSFDRSCMGEHKIMHEHFKGLKNVKALCLSISTCGNFVVIGYNAGHLDKFSVQSGMHRGSFGKETAHDGSVRGVAIDGFSRMVISGGSDKLLKFWRFKDHGEIATMKLEQSVSKMILHRER
ncbi:WD repeat-containing protein 36 [Araneus ventricosus]|uniref:WD repeat-containing protein 36 n=1 Tax=Araneus ventricosus TaxID=182803 RepID=A0A4Y2JJ06_ARAVE|nr:WD repeat-containing protein 36 [Araneus ventricosus]